MHKPQPDPFALMKARAKSAGVKLVRVQSEGLTWYAAEKWAHTKSFTSLADFERWLKHLAGPSA